MQDANIAKLPIDSVNDDHSKNWREKIRRFSHRHIVRKKEKTKNVRKFDTRCM